ncbi:hypothetical protein KIPB_000490 [Kipferlia bialata]|uniref:Uncharacterized protein n=1 Tax=Kipferlia bialata TaxID=797122 RepID=A0A9K3CNP5_9EUKA|nr:hypothetical protein KIPB_000490 [Kipferlia bialata]|eukprot:g490.t1
MIVHVIPLLVAVAALFAVAVVAEERLGGDNGGYGIKQVLTKDLGGQSRNGNPMKYTDKYLVLGNTYLGDAYKSVITYTRDATTGDYTYTDTIAPPTSISGSTHTFGFSLGVSGDNLVIGDKIRDTVYFYTRAADNLSWEYQRSYEFPSIQSYGKYIDYVDDVLFITGDDYSTDSGAFTNAYLWDSPNMETCGVCPSSVSITGWTHSSDSPKVIAGMER